MSVDGWILSVAGAVIAALVLGMVRLMMIGLTEQIRGLRRELAQAIAGVSERLEQHQLVHTELDRRVGRLETFNMKRRASDP